MIFDKVAGKYKMVFALWADEAPIPAIAVDRHGLASVADPAQRVETLDPNKLTAAYQEREDGDGGLLRQLLVYSLQRLVDKHFLVRVEDEAVLVESGDHFPGAGSGCLVGECSPGQPLVQNLLPIVTDFGKRRRGRDTVDL
ncbi:hypothetical protein [Streptomyces sp. NPDC050564]|uniref:hypothetical protein n=1 Tax=Streptomyces sp. NPDC050564 TaxID=3365631 RepID=UPI00378A913F